MSLILLVPLNFVRPILTLENPRTNDPILPLPTPPSQPSSEAFKREQQGKKWEQEQDMEGRVHVYKQPFQPQQSL